MIPPFCPCPGCDAHVHPPVREWWMRIGSYSTRAFGRVQRFRCRRCGTGFSAQTFSLDYYAKRRVEYLKLLAQFSCCCGLRALGRNFSVSKGTIENKLMRLSHQALALQVMGLRRLRLGENLVADGFQSYWVSQYFPTNIHLLVGEQSQFTYAFHGVTIRRSGTMTEAQRKRRQQLEKRYRADAQGIGTSFALITGVLTRLTATARHTPVIFSTDQHKSYPRVLAADGAAAQLMAEGRLDHRAYSSSAPRTTSNPLFAVNYLDRELRKDQAEHVRETTRHARAAHTAMERLAVYLLHHNYFKRYRINQSVDDEALHATEAGLSYGFIRWMRQWLTTRRVFLSRIPVPPPFLDVWLRMYRTPLSRAYPYLPRYALG